MKDATNKPTIGIMVLIILKKLQVRLEIAMLP